MEAKRIIFVLSVFTLGCTSNSILIDNSVIVDENNQLMSSLRIRNFTKDTLVLFRSLDILPNDTGETAEYLELYQINGKALDTIKSGDFHFTPFPVDYLFDQEQLSLHLPPLKTHEYNFSISTFYDQLNKGRYLLRICFKPEFLNKKDTCIVSRFRLKENLGSVNLIPD